MYTYEWDVEALENWIEGGLELLIKHYRFWPEGINWTALVDCYWKLIATINLKKIKQNNLVIKCWWVWQQNYYYQLSWDFLSPIKIKKNNYDRIQKCVKESDGGAW